MMPSWMILGLTAFGAAVLLCLVTTRQSRWTGAALAVAVVNLLVAALNMFAPFRALLDPHYVGYAFGFIQARAGIAVTFAAGSVFLATVACAYLALKSRSLLAVALVDSLLALNLGAGLALSAARGSDFKIQLGEYLTIPGALALLLLLAVLTGPLAASSLWALRSRA
jgi:hypothetical protein